MPETLKFVSWDSKTDLILMLCSKNVKLRLNGSQSHGLASAPAQNLEPDGLKAQNKRARSISKRDKSEQRNWKARKRRRRHFECFEKNLRLVQNKDQLCLSWIKNTRSCQLPISPLEQFILLLFYNDLANFISAMSRVQIPPGTIFLCIHNPLN